MERRWYGKASAPGALVSLLAFLAVAPGCGFESSVEPPADESATEPTAAPAPRTAAHQEKSAKLDGTMGETAGANTGGNTGRTMGETATARSSPAPVTSADAGTRSAGHTATDAADSG